MRLAAYAGASVASAAAVVIYAFNQRSNFYSACVYLSQSNLCLMILTNLILFVIASFMFGLQRLFFGRLRPIEIEQLYEKGWFAVTETCLAMTIFREEVGAWFLVMFVALLAGKVWGWVGEGRVEILEQQPPTNPRLFHLRLSLSLAISLIYDIWLMTYSINTVIQQARPNMMVMFLFEFAILTTSSTSTALRYAISLYELSTIKRQTKARLEARRAEVRAEREEILRQRAAAAATSGSEGTTDQTTADLPSEDDVEEMDIEVPGWEAKGQWILSLDLATDFFKLGIYTAFFFILMAFYGLPIHILRDLFLTARSFVKRLTAFVKYRRATRDMARYPDATVEEIQREDTCIICREEMTPWSVTNPAEPVAGAANGVQQPAAGVRPVHTVNERTRPKRLPCGHVLHLGCLKSWLERQQVCPTCRRPVVPASQQGQGIRPGQGAPGQFPGQPEAPGAGGNAAQHQNPQNRGQNNGNMRVLGFGPLRFAFGQANMQEVAQALNRQEPPQPNRARPRMYGLEFGFGRPPVPNEPAPPDETAVPLTTQIQNIENRIMQEINDLHINNHELRMVQFLLNELVRLRQTHSTPQAGAAASVMSNSGVPFVPQQPPLSHTASLNVTPAPPVSVERHAPALGASVIPSGSADLPPGVTIPEGWTLLPLQRLGGSGVPPPNSSSSMGTATAPVNQAVPSEPTAAHPSSSLSPPSSANIQSLQAAIPNINGSSSSATPWASDPPPDPASHIENSQLPQAASREEPRVQAETTSEGQPTDTSSATLQDQGAAQALSSIGADAGADTPASSHNTTQAPTTSDAVAEPAASAYPRSEEAETQPSLGEASSSSALLQAEPGAETAGEPAAGQDKGKAKAATVEEDTEDT